MLLDADKEGLRNHLYIGLLYNLYCNGRVFWSRVVGSSGHAGTAWSRCESNCVTDICREQPRFSVRKGEAHLASGIHNLGFDLGRRFHLLSFPSRQS